jgi:dolichol-phosphate mannosyltransferase
VDHAVLGPDAQPTARAGERLAAPGFETRGSPELSVIIPTLNERENVRHLLARLESALAGIHWEAIFVDDDSPDGTADLVRGLGRADARVRCIRRIGRRGLAGAGIEGMLAASASCVAVMDADLQHDETLLPRMLARLRGGADLVVATRFAPGGSAETGLSAARAWGSRLAGRVARRLVGTPISDPMSGFFMMRQEAFEALAPRLSTQGFKLLLDIVAAQAPHPLRIAELPYRFAARRHGASKLDGLVVLDYAGLLLAKLSGDRLPVRFVLFALVGASGLLVHLFALMAALSLARLAFDQAQALAAFAAMTWNFALNNRLTYRDRRLRGRAALTGLLSFYAVCSIGALANVGVASWVYGGQPTWWLAGTAGALMGAVFNYAASSAVTWRQR